LVECGRAAVFAGDEGTRSLNVAGRYLAILIPLGLVGMGALYLLYFSTVGGSTVDPDKTPVRESTMDQDKTSVRESTVDQDKLKWAPPVLNNPTTIEIPSTGFTQINLNTTKDYVIELPAQKKVGATVINGGHDLVIKGGYLTVPRNDGEGKKTRGLYVTNSTGTVHVEGVKIDGSGGGYIDGLVFGYMPNAIVQLENMRVVGLHGNAHFHADIIQVWEGVKEIRIDKFTGSSNYQGIFTADEIGAGIYKRTNLFYKKSNVVAESGTNRYLLWLTRSNNSCAHSPYTLENFYIAKKPGTSFGESAWPSVSSSFGCAAIVQNNVMRWPNLSRVTGSVKRGRPPGGDFVPANVAGVGYVSPGYQQ
jgi:hypothetical protein